MSLPALQKRFVVDSPQARPDSSADHHPFFGCFMLIMLHCRRSLSMSLNHSRIETRYTQEQITVLADPHTHRPLLVIREIIERVRVRHVHLEREQQWREELSGLDADNDDTAMQHLYRKVFDDRIPQVSKAA